MRCARVFVCALLWCADTHSLVFVRIVCVAPPRTRKFFLCFFFLFAAHISPSLPSFLLEKKAPLTAFLFLPFFASSETFVASHDGVPISRKKKKKRPGAPFFYLLLLLVLLLPHIFIAWIYTHTRTYIYKHTHTRYIYV